MPSRRPLDPVDQLLLRQAGDPRRRSTIILVVQLARPPDWEVLVDRLRAAARDQPRLRQRIVRPWRDLGPPHWVVERDIDVWQHLARAKLANPGDSDQLLRYVEDIGDDDLYHDGDRTRPLWHVTLLDGLADGRAALVARISHVLTDGLAGMQLLAGLLDGSGPPVPSAEPGDAGTDDVTATPHRLAAEHLLGTPLRLPLRYWRNYATAFRATAALAAHPRRGIGDAARYTRSLVRVAVPRSAPSALPRRGASRRLMLLEVPAADLRRAARTAGGTINDGYLAAVMGGLRRYHEERGERPEEMPFAVPISTRRRGAADGSSVGTDTTVGNRFAGVRFSAPVGTGDPARRIQQVSDIVRSARAEPALDAMTTLAPALVQLPDRVLGLAGRAQDRVDMQASYVPGPRGSVQVAGVEVEAMFSFGPLPGPAAMSVLLTYAGVARVGFTLDAAAVTDVGAFRAAMADGFAEVLDLATGADRTSAP